MTLPKKPETVEDAVLLKSLAEIHRAEGREVGSDEGTAAMLAEADDMDAAAAEMLKPMTHATGLATVGRGGEIAMPERNAYPGIVNTVRTKPDMVTARASHARLDLAGKAMLMALDAADSIQAANSLERMLAHQLAALHRVGMKFAEKAETLLDNFHLGISGNRNPAEIQVYSVEASRCATAAVRAFGGYAEAMLTLDRVRRGGKQTVRVVHVHEQHVSVAPGAQAVVAGKVTGGRGAAQKRTGGGRRNGQ